MTAAEWIATRRELLAAATEGPWRASLLDGVRYEDGSSSYRCGIYPGATQGPPPVFVTNGIDTRDAALIADARASLPRALDALEAVLAYHRPGEGSSQGYTPTGYGYVEPYCAGCEASDEYAVAWPCPTVRRIESALGVKP